MNESQFRELFSQVTSFPTNRFHPLLWVIGDPEIGEHTSIGGFSEINAKDARVVIGAHCDIASFVAINAADSHKVAIGLADAIERRDIVIEDHVFIGSHCVVKGGANIGHHTVVAAGTVVDAGTIPPYSLVSGNPMTVRAGYYRDRTPARSVPSSESQNPGR